ncbi:MAG: YraN family protein [Flavobacteriaceae bacterium]|nr:YraN family protein [Flavobacteriaceae bacterium]
MISKKEEIIVCVEVKARSLSYFGTPELFVRLKKVELLVMAMDAYVQNKNVSLEVRFDIITFLVQNGVWKCEYIEGAFYPF